MSALVTPGTREPDEQHAYHVVACSYTLTTARAAVSQLKERARPGPARRSLSAVVPSLRTARRPSARPDAVGSTRSAASPHTSATAPRAAATTGVPAAIA